MSFDNQKYFLETSTTGSEEHCALSCNGSSCFPVTSSLMQQHHQLGLSSLPITSQVSPDYTVSTSTLAGQRDKLCNDESFIMQFIHENDFTTEPWSSLFCANQLKQEAPVFQRESLSFPKTACDDLSEKSRTVSEMPTLDMHDSLWCYCSYFGQKYT